MMKFTAILAGMGIMATSAFAAGENAIEVDANGDGIVTVEEIQSIFPDITPEAFAVLDSNSDGTLDDSEMVAGQEQGLIPTATDG